MKKIHFQLYLRQLMFKNVHSGAKPDVHIMPKCNSQTTPPLCLLQHHLPLFPVQQLVCLLLFPVVQLEMLLHHVEEPLADGFQIVCRLVGRVGPWQMGMKLSAQSLWQQFIDYGHLQGPNNCKFYVSYQAEINFQSQSSP